MTHYRQSILDLTQRSLDALMRDVKAGRLTDEHVTYLRRIAASVPAALDPSDGVMPPDSRHADSSPRGRNYAAEAAYALALAGIT